MDLGEGFDPAIEALQLEARIVFQNPGLKALGFDGSFEVGNPLAQIVDGVGPAGLLPSLQIRSLISAMQASAISDQPGPVGSVFGACGAGQAPRRWP
jgi:hypothetical protein